MRSLKATAEGTKIAQIVLTSRGWSRQDLADRVVIEGKKPLKGISDQTVDQFFRGRNIDRKFFVAICKTLELSWEEISGFSGKADVEPQIIRDPINQLVNQARETIKPYIQKKLGIIRVLNMTKPIELGEIYTNVHIWEKLTANQRLELSDLLGQISIEGEQDLEQLRLRPRTSKGMSGEDAVSRFPLLMILGKPGAGKTTFLKYLALQCIEGKFLGDRLPIFVTLKDFAEATGQPLLLDYLGNLTGLKERLIEVLQAGRAFILLDGLDEVLQVDSSRVNRQIRELAEKFTNNYLVITCRLAANLYTFEQFTEVELADFDEEQVASFVTRWFKNKNPEKANLFLAKIQENISIKELVNSPLLLTLLCLIFEDKSNLIKNRADLYTEGVELLLEKWDSQRDIERDNIYKFLSTKQKQDLLGKLALATFKKGNYFFKSRDVDYYIQDYISNLHGAVTASEALNLDSKKLLRSIQAQHGLLIETAVNLYSFSHLSFHEYFVAREIVFNSLLDFLAKKITETRWREVFLLTVEMMENADQLVLLIKDQIDQLLSKDEKIQNFLFWLNEKSLSVKSSYRQTSIRAFYFYRCLSNSPFHWSWSMEKLEKNLLIDYYLIKCLNSLIFKFNNKKFFSIDNYAIYLDLKLDAKLAKDIKLKDEVASYRLRHEVLEYFQKKEVNILIPPEQFLQKAIDIADELTCKLLKKDLEDLLSTPQKNWLDHLRNLMISHRNIGHDWQFSNQQIKSLKQYNTANNLLIDCLNRDCYVSREVRQKIEHTLLLPLSKLQELKKN